MDLCTLVRVKMIAGVLNEKNNHDSIGWQKIAKEMLSINNHDEVNLALKEYTIVIKSKIISVNCSPIKLGS